MKTVQEVASMFHISVQAVYGKINKQLNVQLKEHISKVNGILMIDEQGVEIIGESLSGTSAEKKLDCSDTMNSSFIRMFDVLEDTISLLNEQIKMKDQQILNLQQRLEQNNKLFSSETSHLESDDILSPVSSIKDGAPEISEVTYNQLPKPFIPRVDPKPTIFQKIFTRFLTD